MKLGGSCKLTVTSCSRSRHAAYEDHPLGNRTYDASLVGAVLERGGFAVTVGVDLNREEMLKALTGFSRQLRAKPHGVALFYFAGYGVQVGGGFSRSALCTHASVCGSRAKA
jgi:hypothetical protein